MGSVVFTDSYQISSYGYYEQNVEVNFTESYDPATNKTTVTLSSIRMKSGYAGGSSPVYGDVSFSANGSSWTSVKSMNGGTNQVNLATSYSVISGSSGGSLAITHATNGTATLYVKLSGGSGGYWGANVQTYGKPARMFGIETPDTESTSLPTHTSSLVVNPNGGSWGGSTSSQTFTQAPTTTKSISGTPTRTGYTFNGWSLSGKGSFSSGTYTYPGEENATGTLTAQWVINSYTVTCKDYVGSTSGTHLTPDQTASYNYGSSVSGASFGSSTAYDAYHTGYHYTGSSSTVTVPANNNTVVYRYFALNTWTVSYNANGHGTAPSAQTKTYGTNLTLRAFIGNTSGSGTKATYTVTANANGSTWSGSNGSASKTPKYTYSQTGWNTNSSGTGTNYASKASYTANAAATLYAIWNTATSYTYTYTLPTGTPTKSQSVTVTFNANGGSTSKASQSVSRAMTFSGWYTAATGGTKRTTSSQISASETVYAQFTNGTGNYGAATLPTAAQCTRTGFTLKGWYTAASGGSKVGNPGASYTPTANVTLYAQWTPLTYTLSFTKSPDGVVANVTRKESPNGGSTGLLNNGATLYYGDKLQVAYSVVSGYTLQTATINGVTMSDTSVIVGPISGAIAVVITVELGAIVYIGGQDYQIFIWDGSNWNQYEAYIWNGSNWIPY